MNVRLKPGEWSAEHPGTTSIRVLRARRRVGVRAEPAVRLAALGVALAAALLLVPAAHSGDLEFQGDVAVLAPLGAEIERLAAGARGTVGVAALHLESGRAVFLNGEERFPMASTYKVPIAVEVLSQVDAGQRSLDDLVEIRPQDIVDTHGAIRDYLFHSGAKLTVLDHLELMLRLSDNIATDLLLEVAGGGGQVTARMKAAGVSGIRVDRSTRQYIGTWLGRAIDGEDDLIPAEEFNPLVGGDGPSTDEMAKLNSAFNADPRDTATPKAMAALLEGIWRGSVLSKKSTALLIDIMKRCETGANRLSGALPPGAVVAHKTGTIGQTTNDVGVIYLPGDAGHVVAVVFIKESELETSEAREPTIAQIARAAHDFFLLQPRP